jgi:hypothetical protein
MEQEVEDFTDSLYPLEYFEDLANNKKFLRTRKCGCGNCNFIPATVEGCALQSTRTARWLYVTNTAKATAPTFEEGDPGYELREITGYE